MDGLDFPDGAFDLIWSEGAIYHIGFAAGLSAWRRFLRVGGGLAVTELSWLDRSPPEVPRDYWSRLYPAMRHVEDHRKSATAAGYRLIGDFTLPAADWWDGYYTELESRIAAFREQHDDAEARAALDEAQGEIDAFRTCEGSYGYVFYMMERTE